MYYRYRYPVVEEKVLVSMKDLFFENEHIPVPVLPLPGTGNSTAWLPFLPNLFC